MNAKLSAVGRSGLESIEPQWWETFVRPKGNIGPLGVSLLAVTACIPLFMASARVLAFPGMQPFDSVMLDGIRAFGTFLNLSFTLEWVPPSDRWTVLYLLLFPTAALLITIARLTFGMRVLGFRAILIAVGFQEIGIVPSLLLMAIVVAIIVGVRPTMRRIRLPLYARVSVILCIAAMIMVAALFIGPWLRSDVIWDVAFFPIIILAMLAEGIARTIDRDNALTAAWRAGSTILLAVLIAWISQIASVREFALHFPEIMLTQLVLIIYISEFFDFRLLQNWQANLGKPWSHRQARQSKEARIAVVRNRWNTGVIGRMGVAAATKGRKQSIQRIVDALRDEGFGVKVFEGDTSLLRELREYIPPDPRTGLPGGIVLNLAGGIQGAGRFGHLPSLLEMSGLAYTGPDPVAHNRMLDRYVLMLLLRQAGVAVPDFKLMTGEEDDVGTLRFPLSVRPRCEPDAGQIIVEHRRDLDDAIARVAQQYAQHAIVENYIDDFEIRVCLLGNDSIEFLPLLQVDAAGNGKICPAPLDAALADRIRDCAYRSFIAAGCRDYARIDIRIGEDGEPNVVQISSLGIFPRAGSFARSAEVAGYAFRDLMRRIIEIAWIRYGLDADMPANQDHLVNLLTPAIKAKKVTTR